MTELLSIGVVAGIIYIGARLTSNNRSNPIDKINAEAEAEIARHRKEKQEDIERILNTGYNKQKIPSVVVHTNIYGESVKVRDWEHYYQLEQENK